MCDVFRLFAKLNCGFFFPLRRNTSAPGLSEEVEIIISSQCISGCLSPWESASTARSALAAPHRWRPLIRKRPQRKGSGSPFRVGINFSAMEGLWWPNRQGFFTSPLSSFYWLVDFSSHLSEYSFPVSFDLLQHLACAYWHCGLWDAFQGLSCHRKKKKFRYRSVVMSLSLQGLFAVISSGSREMSAQNVCRLDASPILGKWEHE